MPEVVVLRIGHRPGRDMRVTTHVGLCARALGAEGMLLAGKDGGIVMGIADLVTRFGGNFYVRDNVSWRSAIREWKESGGIVVHLTMYGEPLTLREADIKACDRLLLVIGAEKVPGEVFQLSDYNISVTNQPHSEIAALAIVLDHIFEGRTLTREFPDGEIRIVPCANGKVVEER